MKPSLVDYTQTFKMKRESIVKVLRTNKRLKEERKYRTVIGVVHTNVWKKRESIERESKYIQCWF